ncbi:hypothetical protein DSM104443_03461 [Usitatibacter rugosus]|uniref:ER-bound oxygenase mpaB/mpaB'/Rubber oxygenase catalytic domain-containing protein n=1 Tax=Usitatibacter rugosus TaxID=2732067 RepID=A0A6M4GZC3_9PROT|nr:oxygenase MpaB family protein [Usitatibacter rugosus]QJR12375.1 hypothetical protein DSM104443_03461 [Usitatibacter rugosus]
MGAQAITNEDLDAAQWEADPHADQAIEQILGPWPQPLLKAAADAPLAASAKEGTQASPIQERLERIRALNKEITAWDCNDAVANWKPTAATPDYLVQPLQDYVKAALPRPPDGADRERIARAEKLFMDHGALSVTILFCASLPECYVVPDLASVLQATGQLIHRAEHRIRATGAMIFPAMMEGGLTRGDASGIAQILKVRLIHASVRNLILRGTPQAAAAEETHEAIPPLATIQDKDDRHEALYVHGWDLGEDALPNNQEELAYTLLTFSYVFLRSLRKLGIPFERQEEEDYLYLWNVVGHYLGIRPELTAGTYEEAEKLFALMQQRGREDWERTADKRNDPRPALGAALISAMKSAIPWAVFKPFPVLLTRELVMPASARELALEESVGWISQLLFVAILGAARWFDTQARRWFPNFSIARLLTRVIGYRLTCRLLMDQTRDLVVPGRLRQPIHALIEQWGRDPDASKWMNFLEDSLTTFGKWEPLDPPREG